VPSDLPPWGTIYRWFAVWRDDGRFERINHALVMADRERVGRDASPSAVDSQSVKTTHPASIQDRDGGGPLMRASRRIFPFIQRVFADSGYAGEKFAKATLIAVELVRKNGDQVGFATRGAGSSSGSSSGLGAIDGWQRLRGHHRLRTRLPLRRIRHAVRGSDRSRFMTFETDSKLRDV